MAAEQSREAARALSFDLAIEVLQSHGNLRLRATGWSMLPSVWPGDTLVIEPAVSGAVSVGDIVLFARNGRLVAHRIVLKSQGGNVLRTSGDSTRTPDAPVRTHEILGKLSHIERAGKRIKPKKKLGLRGRAVAALLRCTDIAPRFVVRVHKLRAHSSQHSSS